MGAYIESFRGLVYPRHCDHQDHLTTMHYVGFFDQACWHLVSAVGLTRERMRRQATGFVDVKQTLEYLAEQTVGSLIVIESGVLRIGNASFTHFHRMRNGETGVLAATSENVSVLFDLDARTKLALPDDLRARMGEHMVERDG
ncbi:MAG: acyl-CoA thioesterase [Alphaproteobacteria bacterium]